MLHYTYTPSGQKISQQLASKEGMGTRRDYAGPFVYVNNQLAWINLPQGRWVYKGQELKAELHLRDHLGNTRMVLEENDSNLESVQQASYYPFGKAIHGLSSALSDPESTLDNRYLYNGKEFQADFGLDWYDYGARFDDPQIARWHSVDPLAEKYYSQTPYGYAGNNPILFVDYDGMDYGLHFDHKNQTVTIRAHYYTTTNDLSSAQQATDFWNNQSGNYTYTMGSGNDALTYEVNFELMAIEVDNPLAYFQNDSSGEANVFATVGDNDSRF